MKRWKIEPAVPYYSHEKREESLLNWTTRTLFFIFLIIFVLGLVFVPEITSHAINESTEKPLAIFLLFVWIFGMLALLILFFIYRTRHKKLISKFY
ncbi:MAG: hypothetical protein QXP53_01435 [Candidatus Pacearchaeota archaeon]